MGQSISGKKGGLIKGKKHSECDEDGCGVKAVVDGTKTVELQGGEVIINSKAMSDPEVMTVTGTKKEIASKINSDKGYGVKFEEGGEVKPSFKTVGELPNSKKTTTFTKKDIDYVISGESKDSNEKLIKSASNFIRTKAGTIKEGVGTKQFKQKENELLIEFAIENGLLFESPENSLYISEGTEQSVYEKTDETVIKLNSGLFYQSWSEYFDSLLLHNHFFPDTRYKFIGISIIDGEVFAVVEQLFIVETEPTDLKKVEQELSENGFVRTKGNDYINHETGVILEDLHESNVITKNGVLHFIDTVFYLKNPYSKFESGGEVSDNKETYKKWRSLVNMSYSELKRVYDSEEGKKAGLKPSEAKAEGIDYGRESARWILKMKKTPVKEWTPAMWKWANKQISFISRMSGNKGGLYDEKGNKTRKHLSLLIWGNNPKKYELGGEVNKETKMDKQEPYSKSLYKERDWYAIESFLKDYYSDQDVDEIMRSKIMRFVEPETYRGFLKFYKAKGKQYIHELLSEKNIDSQLSKGTEVELEHKDTIEEIASGKLSPEEGAKEIAKDHIAEDPAYYDKLEKMEQKPEEDKIKFNPSTIDELKKSLSLAKSKGIAESAIYDMQKNYFSDVVSNDPEKLGEFLLAIDGLTKKERFDFQMELNSRYGNTEAIDRFSGNLAKSGRNIYDLLPAEFKKQTKVKRIDFTPSPNSDGLSKITDLFVGQDDLRPVMRGVYFDKENGLISATDAHKLIVIAQKPDVEKSSICEMGSNLKSEIKSLTKSSSAEEAIHTIEQKTNSDGCFEIEGNYPQYIRVIPTDYSEIFDFSANFLMNYADTMSKHLTNTTTRQMLLGYKSEENGNVVVGVNAVFLATSLKGMQMLGHDALDFCHNGFKDKAIVLVPKGQSRKITTKRIETDLSLCMPIMVGEENDNMPIYDLTDNTIKTVAQFYGRETKAEVYLEPMEELSEKDIFYRDMPKDKVKDMAEFWGNRKMMWNKREIRLTKEDLETLTEVQIAVNKFHPEYNYLLTNQPVSNSIDPIEPVVEATIPNIAEMNLEQLEKRLAYLSEGLRSLGIMDEKNNLHRDRLDQMFYADKESYQKGIDRLKEFDEVLAKIQKINQEKYSQTLAKSRSEDSSQSKEIKDTIDGLEILKSLAKTKKEKKEIQNEIDGLNILLEMPETFGLGGEVNIDETTFKNSAAYIETVESLKQTGIYDPSLSDSEVYQYYKAFGNPKFSDAPEYFEHGGII